MEQSRLLILACVTLLALSLVVVLPSEAKTDLTKKDVVGIWLFDEIKDDKAQDTSGNGLSGKIEGQVEIVDGKFGQALQFDGNSYVEIPFNELLNVKHMTLMCWIHAEAAGAAQIHRWKPPAYTLEIFEGRTTPVIMTTAGFKFNKPPQQTPLNEWVHIAGTYDGKNLIAYQNGEAVDTLEHQGDIEAGKDVVRFGARTDNDGGRYQGVLDEVAIFGEALTQQEIQDIMNNGFESVLNPKPTHIEFKNKLPTHWGKIKGNYIKKDQQKQSNSKQEKVNFTDTQATDNRCTK